MIPDFLTSRPKLTSLTMAISCQHSRVFSLQLLHWMACLIYLLVLDQAYIHPVDPSMMLWVPDPRRINVLPRAQATPAPSTPSAILPTRWDISPRRLPLHSVTRTGRLPALASLEGDRARPHLRWRPPHLCRAMQLRRFTVPRFTLRTPTRLVSRRGLPARNILAPLLALHHRLLPHRHLCNHRLRLSHSDICMSKVLAKSN